MKYKKRYIKKRLLRALEVSPIVFVNGPRQAGKSTLAQELMREGFEAEYVTLDNISQLSAASSSPLSFLRNRKGALIIDEVQLAPELFRSLKIVVDEMRQVALDGSSNGRYLLTGSANVLALPKLSDALVGRMSVNSLYPFAVVEAVEGEGDFIERLFSGNFIKTGGEAVSLENAMRLSTFPEISGKTSDVRSIWMESYISTLLQRDIRAIAELEKIALLPTLLRLLATRAGSLVNDSEIARNLGTNSVTTKNYRWALEMMFLVFEIRPWFKNIEKRSVKASKLFFTDTLLLCHILEQGIEGLRGLDPSRYGHIVENFVAAELRKLLSFCEIKAELYFFRTSDGKEVDFVLERPDGRISGIEVKATDYPSAKDFTGLKLLRELAADRFQCGVVLYPGKEVIPFGEELWAVPMSSLWGS